jgi:hypothetical protein
MTEQWNQQRGFNLTTRLGYLAIRAHGVVLARRMQSIQRMTQAHTRDLLKLPGGKRKLREMEKQLDRVKQIIQEGTSDGK